MTVDAASLFLDLVTDNKKQVHIIGPLVDQGYEQRPNIPHIFVDGGAIACKNPGESLLIGDGDSAPKEMHCHLREKLDTNKDFSDLAYAFQLITDEYFSIHLFGFMGGRLDHQLCVFGEAYKFLCEREATSRLWFYGDDDLAMITNEKQVNINIEGAFSLLVFGENKLTISGEVDYPLDRKLIESPFSSLTLSNIGRGALQYTSDDPVLLITARDNVSELE